MSGDDLFPQSLVDELRELPVPHPAFIVSLLTRDEPAIVAFRDQIKVWFSNLDGPAREHFQAALHSQDNQQFFQGFAELAIHEIFRYHDIDIAGYGGGAAPIARANGGADPFSLAVHSYLPELQMRGSLSVFRHLVRELNTIHHHYYFSVFLKRWLPYDFDAKPIRRALEVWLDSLDDGSWHGKYAEYRDDKVHLEFSILDKLDEDRKNLVRFRISPLRSPEVLVKVQEGVEALLRDAEAAGESDKPLLATVFSNEDWSVPEGYLHDFVYGKADYSFNWTTHAGRVMRLKGFQKSWSKYGIFSDDRYDRVSAVVICDKEWERDKVVFSLRVMHNPWAKNPLPASHFKDFAQYRIFERDGDVAYMGWENSHRARFRLP